MKNKLLGVILLFSFFGYTQKCPRDYTDMLLYYGNGIDSCSVIAEKSKSMLEFKSVNDTITHIVRDSLGILKSVDSLFLAYNTLKKVFFNDDFKYVFLKEFNRVDRHEREVEKIYKNDTLIEVIQKDLNVTKGDTSNKYLNYLNTIPGFSPHIWEKYTIEEVDSVLLKLATNGTVFKLNQEMKTEIELKENNDKGVTIVFYNENGLIEKRECYYYGELCE